jgi:hypothetical protein
LIGGAGRINKEFNSILLEIGYDVNISPNNSKRRAIAYNAKEHPKQQPANVNVIHQPSQFIQAAEFMEPEPQPA